MPPQANHLQVAPRGLLSYLNESQGFDVAFVPARPQAIELAQAHVPVTVVVSDMYDDLLKMTDTIFSCPVLLGLTRYPGNKFLGWDELFDVPEPVPGLMDAVDKWAQEALDEGRPQARMLSNDLTAVHERALANSTTLEEFRQAVESAGAYPVRGKVITAVIDRHQGAPRGTTETVATS